MSGYGEVYINSFHAESPDEKLFEALAKRHEEAGMQGANE
jgi:hypothetical protein